jgi:hypothetical protein
MIPLTEHEKIQDLINKNNEYKEIIESLYNVITQLRIFKFDEINQEMNNLSLKLDKILENEVL